MEVYTAQEDQGLNIREYLQSGCRLLQIRILTYFFLSAIGSFMGSLMKELDHC